MSSSARNARTRRLRGRPGSSGRRRRGALPGPRTRGGAARATRGAHAPPRIAGSSSIKWTEPGNPWTFRIMPNEVMQGINLAENASKRIKAETAVLLFENTNAGIGNAQVFKENFIKHGGKVLAEIGFGRDVNDFT